jgi:hypothetical protein
MTGEKIRLKEEAISEILVADTDSEPGAETRDVEDYFEEEEEEKKKKKKNRRRRRNNNSSSCKPQQKSP